MNERYSPVDERNPNIGNLQSGNRCYDRYGPVAVLNRHD